MSDKDSLVRKQQAKDFYKQMRKLPASRLWDEQVPEFNSLPSDQREQHVGLVRAIGVKLSVGSDDQMKADVKEWLIKLLSDESEKVRRYAVAAIVKIGSDATVEGQLLSLMQQSRIERERQNIAAALAEVGNTSTLHAIIDSCSGENQNLLHEQKIRASYGRSVKPSFVNLTITLPALLGKRLHLHCRTGLEATLVQELLEDRAEQKGKFRLVQQRVGGVIVEATEPFSLSDLYRLRCFDTVGFTLGKSAMSADYDFVSNAIASRQCEQIMTMLTSGSQRYRLAIDNAVSSGKISHSKSLVRQIIKAAYAKNQALLNDGKQAPWVVDVSHSPDCASVELRPRVMPNPRLKYQTSTFYAGAHPPLAASMVRMGGRLGSKAVVWDPFCGSGMELIEAAIGNAGNILQLVGTDIDTSAIAVAEANVEAAKSIGAISRQTHTSFHAIDFREIMEVDARNGGIDPGTVSLIITNPPLGQRVKVKGLRSLFGVSAFVGVS